MAPGMQSAVIGRRLVARQSCSSAIYRRRLMARRRAGWRDELVYFAVSRLEKEFGTAFRDGQYFS